MSASYGIDKVDLVVWLDSSPALDPALAGSLCRRHADALIVPKGWRIDDRRESIPRLFHAPDVDDTHGSDTVSAEIVDLAHTPSGGVRRRVQRGTARSSAQASLFDEASGDAVAAAVSESTTLNNDSVEPTSGAEEASETDRVESGGDDIEETKAIPWMPRLVSRNAASDSDSGSDSDAEDDVDATPAQGRLLRRAFGDRNVR